MSPAGPQDPDFIFGMPDPGLKAGTEDLGLDPADLGLKGDRRLAAGVDQEGFHVAAAPPVSGQAGIQSPVRVCPKDIRKSPAVIKSKGGVPVVFRHGRKPVLVHNLLAHGFTDRRGDQDMIGDAVFPSARSWIH